MNLLAAIWDGLDKGTLANWATFVIAAIALLQPHAISLWNRYFRRPLVSVSLRPIGELGLFVGGHSVVLVGTAFVKNRSCVIKNIHLKVTREQDQATLELSWAAFRPLEFSADPNRQTLTLATATQVSPDSPLAFQLLFAPELGSADPHVDAIKAAAFQAHVRLYPEVQQAQPDLPNDALLAVVNGRVSQDKATRTEIQRYWQQLNDDYFWKPGKFKATMRLELGEGNADPIHLTFEVDSAGSQSLRANCIAISEGVVGPSGFLYSHVIRLEEGSSA